MRVTYSERVVCETDVMAALAEPTKLASPELRRLISRRFTVLVGVGLSLCAAVIAAALATYEPSDPSLNTATMRPVHNLLGTAGATLSDTLLQGFGVASALPVAALFAWAFLAIRGRSIGGGLLGRIALLVVALPVAAASAAEVANIFGVGYNWPTPAGPGGAIGAVIATKLLELTRSSLGIAGAAILFFFWAILTAILSVLVLGIGRSKLQYSFNSKNSKHSDPIFKRMPVAERAAPFNVHEVPRAIVEDGPTFNMGAVTLDHPGVDSHIEPDIRRAFGIYDEQDQAVGPLAGDPELTRPTAISSLIARSARKSRAETIQPVLALEPGWRLPPLNLLTAAPNRDGSGVPAEEALIANDRLLESVLRDYGVQGTIVNHRPGPVVTLYELEPAPGIRSARVIGLADDVARSLSVTAVRIATVPGRNVIGIEVPNSRRETVFFSELLSARAWHDDKGRLPIALGKTIGGDPVIADLARMPHLLVAGTTGSGKSVGINAMILSLLFRLSPEQCRLILIDPKMLELSVYEGIPHLMAPVVTEPKKAVVALKWTVREMERRYRSMSQLSVRNIGGYNDRVVEARRKGEVVTRRVQTGFDSETGKPTFEDQMLALEPLPFIVVVIDEMADLMMVAGKEIEAAVQRLAQMARAAGIHVVMATQRPSVDVITGTIKANFPTRISFQVISKFDSRTILGEQGSEQLLGMGDMLYMAGGGRIQRVHGPFVDDDEVEKVVAFLREQGEPAYLDEVTEVTEGDDEQASVGNATDAEKGLFDHAVDIVAREGKASTSFLQRHLQIGYNRAAKLIEQMEKEGIVSASNHVGRREVLVRRSVSNDDF